MLVQVYTADDQLHLYEITEVRPVVPFETALDEPFAATTDQLWLQTSIGPAGTKPKMQVIAEPLSLGPGRPRRGSPDAEAGRLRLTRPGRTDLRSSRSDEGTPPSRRARTAMTALTSQKPVASPP